MFDWLFGSGCPLDPPAKAWAEERLAWLRDEFGPDDLYGGTVILPTPAFFPDPYDGTRRAARVLFDRVCEYMGVEPGVMRLEFFRPSPTPLFLVNGSGEALPTEAAGWYTDEHIRFNEDTLADPITLVGVMAHELAHQRLLGEGRILSEVYDNELLTDLTVVFKGMGIFLANLRREFDGNYTFWPGTELRKPEYMTDAMFGYALALLAWVRGEDKPAWAGYVKSGVRGELRQGLRFLRKHGTDRLKPLARPRKS